MPKLSDPTQRRRGCPEKALSVVRAAFVAAGSSPSLGIFSQAAKKQVNRLLKTCHKRLKETNAPMSPSVPFCTAHLEAHFVRTYAPSPFFELVSRLVTLLESLPDDFYPK